MRFGIALQSNKTPAEYVAQARAIDRHPFDVVSVYNDLFFQPALGPGNLRSQVQVRGALPSLIAMRLPDPAAGGCSVTSTFATISDLYSAQNLRWYELRTCVSSPPE